jgi:acyl dehydratase
MNEVIVMMPAVLEGASQSLGYFDDLRVGDEFYIGRVSIGLQAALAFANIFDPFSFHVDEAAAKNTMFNGIIVSGLQTLSAVHALSIKGSFLREDSVVCGAGLDELRFVRPVRPNDVLNVSAAVQDLKAPRRERGTGIARLKYLVENQDQALVLTFIDNHVLRLRTENP